MIPLDPIALMNRLYALYGAYPGEFHSAGTAVMGVLSFMTVVEIVARLTK